MVEFGVLSTDPGRHLRGGDLTRPSETRLSLRSTRGGRVGSIARCRCNPYLPVCLLFRMVRPSGSLSLYVGGRVGSCVSFDAASSFRMSLIRLESCDFCAPPFSSITVGDCLPRHSDVEGVVGGCDSVHGAARGRGARAWLCLVLQPQGGWYSQQTPRAPRAWPHGAFGGVYEPEGAVAVGCTDRSLWRAGERLRFMQTFPSQQCFQVGSNTSE